MKHVQHVIGAESVALTAMVQEPLRGSIKVDPFVPNWRQSYRFYEVIK
jgi:cyanate lyase